jgi:predicted ATPase
MGISLVLVGDVADGCGHLERVIALYDPVDHRPLATRFGHDVRMTAFCWRALALWMLGYPKAAAVDVECALKDAREIGHAATSMFALSHASLARILRRDHAVAWALADELVALAEEKGSLYWKSYGLMLQGWLLAQAGKATDAVPTATVAIAAIRSTGATAYAPWYLAYLARAYAELGQFNDAWRCIADAITAAETTRETWCEADIHRIAGDMALMLACPDTAKAEASFGRALSVARKQKAKSFELRAAMSMARLWRDQGKQQDASDLLMPMLGWFTEGSDTPDQIEAKVLLDTLSPSQGAGSQANLG